MLEQTGPPAGRSASSRPRRREPWRRRLLTGLALVPLAAGCAGPDLLTDGHLAYNEAVRRSTDRELLLNIVRARHGDTIEFLSTASINSTVRFNAGLSGGYESASGASTTSTGVSFGYSGGPTFTFVPQRGPDFAASLTHPIEVSHLLDLAATCSDLELVLQVLISRMNGLENRIGAVGAEFLQAVRSFAELERSGAVVLGLMEEREVVSPPMPADSLTPSILLDAIGADLRVEAQDDPAQVAFTRARLEPVLYVSEDGPAWATLAESLRLDPGRTSYHLKKGELSAVGDARLDTISLRTRSLLEVLVYLGQGVDAPPEEECSDEEARVAEVARQLLHVRRSDSEPDDALLSIRYDGSWYSISALDAQSRHTFFLLATAFRFGLEGQAEAAPDLNLVIGT